MKHLIIVGARGWGREVYATAVSLDGYNKDFDIKGFLDSKSTAFDGLNGDFPPILGAPEDYEIQPDDVFFIAMGEPKWRKYYAEVIEKKGGTFMSIISKGAFINKTAIIGDGSFVAGWTFISDNVKIGKHGIVHIFSDLGHDVQVGDYCTIEAYSFLGGYAKMGNESVMHVRSTLIRTKSIGNNVEVGSSSVVMRNVADGLHVFGNPAKKIDF